MLFYIVTPDDIMDRFRIKICSRIVGEWPFSWVDHEILKFKDAGAVDLRDFVACCKHIARANNKARPRQVLDYCRNTRKRTRLVEVVRVQNADVLGPRHIDTFVKRIRLPAVGLRYPSEIRMRPGFHAKDIHSPIT